MNGDIVLRMKGISKAFPGVVALNDVSFDQRRGEIHSLIGENGAGKSTLMKILGGAYVPDHGEIEIDGKTVAIETPRDALNLRISVIYQEFNLVPTLSIAENIFLGKEIVTGPAGHLNRSAMRARAKDALVKLGLANMNFRTQVRYLSIAQQQLVEIGKALFNNASILVMDEPTSVLSQKESERLFQLMRELRQQGISIIYISHRLEEVLELSDRITVLRDGEVVCTLDNGTGTVTRDELIRHMVGRSLQDYFPPRNAAVSDEKLLEVHGLCREGEFRDISFDLHRGEILGFYGLVGAGRTEIMQAVFAVSPPDSGTIRFRGEEIEIRSVSDAIRRGIVLVPEDRKREGLVTMMSLGDNICLPNLERINTFGAILPHRRKSLVEEYMKSLSITPALPNRQARDFSGGNQQKAVIAKWLARRPQVLIFDEPTRGIDVGAKAEIYQLIERLSEQGVGILFVSSELMEILGMCDRVIVVHEGRITGDFPRSEVTQEKLMHAASGTSSTEPEHLAQLSGEGT